MLLLEGTPISPGYEKGVAVVYDFEIERKFDLPHRSISHWEVESECSRLNVALEQSSGELKGDDQPSAIEPRVSEVGRMLSAQSAMATDIASLVKQHIGSECVNVEQALEFVIREVVARFKELDTPYLREREQDVRDVGRRMARHLANSPPWNNPALPPGSIIVARELLPSEAVELARSGVIAIVTEQGGEFSHTAIVARSLGIPAITGIVGATSKIEAGMSLLVDGVVGSVVANPSQSDEESFEIRKREYEILAASSVEREKLPCVTQDGVEIALRANIGLPEEAAGVAEHNLAGAGLFRTEVLFLESRGRPTLQGETDIYDGIVRNLNGLPLVIRTFDLGGDKLPPFLLLEGSRTPASLHLRGLRFLLSERSLLDTQLRAILHVAQTADVRILFPMVIGGDDFARAIDTVDRLVEQLGLLRRPPIGAMIETPAALFSLGELVALADFLAIGTNDLTQYMLAVDRDLADKSDDCTAMHPAVLRAIRQVVEAAEERQCPVCVCGEEAGDPDFACLLVGLGIRELSFSSRRGAAVRQAIRGVNSQRAKEIAVRALDCRTPGDVRELLGQLHSSEAIRTPSRLARIANA